MASSSTSSGESTIEPWTGSPRARRVFAIAPGSLRLFPEPSLSRPLAQPACHHSRESAALTLIFRCKRTAIPPQCLCRNVTSAVELKFAFLAPTEGLSRDGLLPSPLCALDRD